MSGGGNADSFAHKRRRTQAPHEISKTPVRTTRSTLHGRRYCPLCSASKFRPAIKAKFSMTQWRLRCRERNQPKPPRVLMNYRGLGKDNDMSVLQRVAAPGTRPA